MPPKKKAAGKGTPRKTFKHKLDKYVELQNEKVAKRRKIKEAHEAQKAKEAAELERERDRERDVEAHEESEGDGGDEPPTNIVSTPVFQNISFRNFKVGLLYFSCVFVVRGLQEPPTLK